MREAFTPSGYRGLSLHRTFYRKSRFRILPLFRLENPSLFVSFHLIVKRDRRGIRTSFYLSRENLFVSFHLIVKRDTKEIRTSFDLFPKKSFTKSCTPKRFFRELVRIPKRYGILPFTPKGYRLYPEKSIVSSTQRSFSKGYEELLPVPQRDTTPIPRRGTGY